MYASDLKHPRASLEDKLHHLYNLNRDKKIDLSFRPPYLDLLKAFGNPHKNLPPVIHVAGTNGKGSIIAMLRAMLEEGGYTVHAYTSPHLIRFNERIRLAGEPIADDMLEDLIDEAIALNTGGDVTFFEITTAMAFAAFSRVPADIVLLETGLGGRLDCTNVVKTPLATVISSISRDHEEFLGDTLQDIAAEKAGIMKPGTPCIIGMQTAQAVTEGVIDVFKHKASALNAELFHVEHLPDVAPNLTGAHQKQNAAAALQVLDAVQHAFPVSQDARQTGLQNIAWPGRLQKLDAKHFGLTPDQDIWLDSGHNPGAGETLAHWASQDTKPLHMVTAMLNHKDPRGFLEPLLPHINTLYVTDIPGEPKSLKAPELIEKLGDIATDTKVIQAKDVQSATDQIAAAAGEPVRILIAGSVYLAGDVLKRIEQ